MKPKALIAIAAGSLLFLAGCGTVASLPNKTDSTTAEDTTSQTDKMGLDKDTNTTRESQDTKAIASAAKELLNTIDVEITSEEVMANFTRVDAGSVSFDIRNSSEQPQSVLLLRTDLPDAQIPIKEGKVDLSQQGVSEVGKLVTDPMTVNDDETITRTLTPGTYVLMAYTPGEIELAKKQIITVVEPK